MNVKEAAEKYSKKWGVSLEEAENKIKQMMAKNEKIPSYANLFPEPLGPISEKIQDVNQALLSTAYTRKMLEAPPEEISELRGRIEKIDEVIEQLRNGVQEQIRELSDILRDKKEREIKEELLSELENKMKPLSETLQALAQKLEKVERGEKVTSGGNPISPGQILEEAERVADEAKNWLSKIGYRVEPESLSKEEVRKMIEEAQRQAIENIPPEELKKRLEQAGYRVIGGPLTYEQVEQMIQEAKKQAQEELIEDKRLSAVENIVSNSISKIIELFKPAIETYFRSSVPEDVGMDVEPDVPVVIEQEGPKSKK